MTIIHNSKKVGFTCGAFDLFHAGHVLALSESKQFCDYLIVGLHTNPTLDRKEKNLPIQSTFERYVQLTGCKFVDEIVPYDTELDLLNLLRSYKIDVRFIGADYIEKEFTGKHLDIPVVYTSRSHDYSTTELRNRFASPSAEDAEELVAAQWAHIWRTKSQLDAYPVGEAELPTHDEAKLRLNTPLAITVDVQVNGLRLSSHAQIDQAALLAFVRADPNVARHLTGKTIRMEQVSVRSLGGGENLVNFVVS